MVLRLFALVMDSDCIIYDAFMLYGNPLLKDLMTVFISSMARFDKDLVQDEFIQALCVIAKRHCTTVFQVSIEFLFGLIVHFTTALDVPVPDVLRVIPNLLSFLGSIKGHADVFPMRKYMNALLDELFEASFAILICNPSVDCHLVANVLEAFISFDTSYTNIALQNTESIQPPTEAMRLMQFTKYNESGDFEGFVRMSEVWRQNSFSIIPLEDMPQQSISKEQTPSSSQIMAGQRHL